MVASSTAADSLNLCASYSFRESFNASLTRLWIFSSRCLSALVTSLVSINACDSAYFARASASCPAFASRSASIMITLTAASISFFCVFSRFCAATIEQVRTTATIIGIRMNDLSRHLHIPLHGGLELMWQLNTACIALILRRKNRVRHWLDSSGGAESVL